MRKLLKYQCLNTYLTPMLKPSKLSDLFPQAHQNQRMSKYCICWTSTWRRFVKVFSVVLYTVTPLFFGFRANWKFSGPRWNIPFRTSQMRHLEVSRNSTFFDNYERSNYVKNFQHVCLAMIRQLVRLWLKYKLPCRCIKWGRSPTEDNLNTRQVKKKSVE